MMRLFGLLQRLINFNRLDLIKGLLMAMIWCIRGIIVAGCRSMLKGALPTG